MAEFTIDINFNLDTSGIEEAEARLENLTNSNVEALNEKFQETTAEVERLKEELEFAEEFGFLNDVEELQTQLAEAEAEAENLASALDNMDFSSSSQGASEVADNIKQASDNMDEFGSKTDDANSKMQETVESSSSLGEALVGVGSVVGLDAMVQTGDNIQTSWNRLSLTFEGTGVSMDTLKQKTSELREETGRSGGEIREYFNQMGIAGVTNTTLLTTSFEALAGASYQTGKPIQTLQNGLQTMTLTGTASNKMLKNLGLSTEDLGNAMGVTSDQASDTFKSLSQEERLQVLTTAMGDGTKANEMYKESYAGLKAQAEASLGGLVGAIGQSILPVVIPALQTARSVVDGLTSTWKSLPSPITSVIGAIGGGVMGITALVSAFSLLSKALGFVWSALGKVFGLYGKFMGLLTKVRTIVNAVRSAESLSAGIKGVLATALGVESVAEEGNAVAKGSAVAPTTALAIAENSLLLPILLVIGAIVGLVAILWYLYNNNEMVRNGINWLIESFKQFVANLIQTAQNIASFVANSISKFLQWVSGGRQSATDLVNAIYNAIVGLPSRISSAMNGVTRAITKPFEDAWNIVKPYVDQIGSAWNSISGIFNGFEGYEGFNGNVGYEGFGNSLNGALASSTSNNSTVTNNFNINGIIEESASEYIVGAVNNHLKKENLIRGV